MKPLPHDPVFRGILLAALTACAAKSADPVETPAPDPSAEPAPSPEPAETPTTPLTPATPKSDVYGACGAGDWAPGRDVTPVEPIDGLQLRTGMPHVDKGAPRAAIVQAMCTEASNEKACVAEAGKYPMGAVRTDMAQVGEVRKDFVYSRGDATGHIDSRDALIAWLGPIDSVADARTVAWADGYTPSCDTEPESSDGSWTIAANKRVDDCPVTTNGYDLKITGAGEVTVVKEYEGTPGKVCIGRLPPGVEERCQGDDVGSWLADAAHLESAAVVAFEQLIAELVHHGAPREIVEAARSARQDEVRHAVAMTALAERYGASVEPCEATVGAIRSLSEIAADNAREGLVREGFGAAVGLWQAKHAADPVVRATLRTIALDEIRHAELSRAIDAWIRTRLDGGERAVLELELARARTELRPGAEYPQSLRSALGLPSLETAQTLFDRVAA